MWWSEGNGMVGGKGVASEGEVGVVDREGL